MKTVQEMTTAELLAEYNLTTGKSTTKFSSRAAGEKAVSMLRDTAARDHSINVYGFEVHGLHRCPHCDINLENGVGQHGDDVNGKPLKLNTNQFFCLGCGGEFGPELKHAAKSVTRSTSISESWNNAEIAAKRARRDNVEVNGVQYRSVAQAFQKLNLPMEKHIQFRMELKASGASSIVSGDKTYNFQLVKKG